jgi:two-component system nitrogen regulation sensor histidine kinase NtrY
MRTSMEGRLAALATIAAAVGIGLTVLFTRLTSAPGLSALLSLPLAVLGAVLLARAQWRSHARSLHALADGLERLADRDFSAGISSTDSPVPLDLVARRFNNLIDVMREERQTLFQRELLLDTVLKASPLAVLLTDASERVLYSNPAARHLLAGGRQLDGHGLDQVLSGGPPGLAEMIRGEREGLCTIELEHQSEVFHLSRRSFTLNARRHSLYLIKQLTQEMSRQEVATWKRVIRVISHELNNSLAPMRSLANSGRAMVAAGEQLPRDKLALVFDTIVDRAEHLGGFIQAYARFAKLPSPQLEAVEWAELMHVLAPVIEFRLVGPARGVPVVADRAQLEQVMINLLKNAHESGSPVEAIEVELTVAGAGGHADIAVRDRGQGMSEETLANALLPFYSTKRSGSGLGLALCREIVEAHGGRLRLANRTGGGLEVIVRLPSARAGSPAVS